MPEPAPLAVIYRSVDDLIPYAKNARTHGTDQIEVLAASIREFGFTNPILIDSKRGMIAGHGRLIAARLVGLTEVPTIELAHLTPTQRRAYVLADNQTALRAAWDLDTLRGELAELAAESYDLMLTGFGTDDLDRLLRPSGSTDPDAVPEPSARPVPNPGDVWRLGAHTLVCGDATDAHTVTEALDGFTPTLMVTDPPYGVDYDAAWRVRVPGIWTTGNKRQATGTVTNDHRGDWREAWALYPGDVAYVWYNALDPNAADALVHAGFMPRNQIVWVKERFIFGRGDYHWQHEPCWYAVRRAKAGKFRGDRRQSTVWFINVKEAGEHTAHSTQKPVELFTRAMENSSKQGDHVYDPFCGSGTSLIAAEMTGRIGHGIEVSPAYCDIIIRRWMAYTDHEASLDGVPYAGVAANRAQRKRRSGKTQHKPASPESIGP
jgi:DNA modification methylase